MTITVDLVMFVVLLGFVVLASRETPRAWLVRAGKALATRFTHPEHTPEWELEQAELWLMARRRQLIEDLSRIERLLSCDESMPATRQLGNRLARDQLIASIARIPEVLPGRDRSLATSPAYEALAYDRPAPSPALATRGPVVEMLDVSGWRR